jgi:hypothetical protein
MNFYKPVNWINPEIDEILSWISLPDISKTTTGYIGKIDKSIQLKICEALRIKTNGNHQIMLVYVQPKSSISIHTDHRTNILDCDQANQTIMLPLKNCDKLHFSWWNVDDPTLAFSQGMTNRYSTVLHVDEKNASLIENVCCAQPMVSNIKQWHNVTNAGDAYAIGLSIRIFPWSNQQNLSLPPIDGITELEAI